MGLTFFIKLVFETLKPYKYRGLSQRSLAKTISFFLILSLLYVAAMGIVNAPAYYKNFKDTGTNMSGFDKFEVDLVIKTNQPVVLSNSPKIVVDTSDNRTVQKQDDVLVTADNITTNFMFWNHSTPIAKYDFLQNIDKLKRNIFILMLGFIPAIFAVAYTIVLIKYFLIILLFGVLASILVIIRRNNVTVLSVFKIATYSLTVYYIANIVGLVIGVKLLGIILYTIFFVVALFLIKEDNVDVDAELGA